MRLSVGRNTVFAAALSLFTFTLCLFVGIFAFRSGREGVALPQKYWFLVRVCEDTAAGAVAGESYLAGGAGYLLEEGVILACYYSEGDAEAVQSRMREKGIETQILMKEGGRLGLGAHAGERERILSNARTVDSAARLLYDTANGLERAELSQEEARAATEGVVQSICGLVKDNGEGYYSLWNAALSRLARRGTEIASGIIYAKDLRYLQVGLCELVLTMEEYF